MTDFELRKLQIEAQLADYERAVVDAAKFMDDYNAPGRRAARRRARRLAEQQAEPAE